VSTTTYSTPCTRSHKPDMFRRVAAVAVVGVLLLPPGPATAHTLTELDTWYADWHQRVEQGLTVDLVAEVSDMMDRHPTYLPPGFRHSPQNSPHAVSAGSEPVGSTNTGMGSDWEQWRPLVAAIWPAGLVDTAVCIIEHESGGNPNALNPSGASGLFQVKPFWFDTYGGNPFNPADNIVVAYQVYLEQGFGAWSVYNAGKC